MSFPKASRGLEEHFRLTAVREIDFKDLVDAGAQRDRMLGGVGNGPDGRLPWGRLDSEEDDIAFLRNLAEGHGLGSPLGDRIVLAIRIVANTRDEKVLARLADVIEAWIDTMQREEDAEDGNASLRTVFDILRRELETARE